jgi:hypothetical protein
MKTGSQLIAGFLLDKKQPYHLVRSDIHIIMKK